MSRTQRGSAFALAILALTAPQRRAAPAADHHQHLFSPVIVKNAPDITPVDAADLVRLLDAARIQRAVVLSLAYQYGNPNRPAVRNEYERVRAENDWTAEQVARFPDRLRAFCSVNPLKEYALDEIGRCATNPRLRTGLKMHFGNSDVDLANDQHLARLKEVFAAANDRGMAILVHLRTSVSRKRPYGAAYARAFLDHLMPAAAAVPVQIAHLAGAGGYDDPLVDEALGVFVSSIAASDARVKRLYFDVSGVAGLGDWKPKAPRIARRIREIGIRRILYGSDGATGGHTPRAAWTAFRQLPLSNAEFHAIRHNVPDYMR
ncbi:MAG TPA: amidohydrolase family protein [Vicinamibacterales bacterium]|jgi:predicted TIM-barrel fold metal-dependent hydrolase|nr:amidohydrolase family protein [Vicinamibacterales bacterium]